MASPRGAFTEDGVFDGLSRVSGRPDLLTFFSGLAADGMTALGHHVTNHEIAVKGDVATVRSLLWQPCVVDGVAHVAAGRYADLLLRTPQGWRYIEKKVRFHYWVPLTDGWDHHRYTPAAARHALLEG